ncbi:Tubulin-specific chaperone D [Fusarium oxysporum f. sp. cubense race 1]|uniref:Tubulin-specific chaperone D n=1 Tax=Fusarium oxysporum f. sp. cubense (strain race 1) TaxID=1229664 RepID=N4UC13_FUSC1|nr:Tubulin-specific chaperone D [Fusarium oxysporum f. sp. cubense race 1]
MDAPEADFDIKLQKISADLLGDFDRSLPSFLWKPDGHGGTRVRSRVRAKEIFRLTNTLLDPFQELPQLLDPYLPKWIPLLAEAFLKHLQTRHRGKALSSRSKLLVSVEFAICKIIYTFCKIRGEKVIVRFLNVEAKYLELLLSAIEESEQASVDDVALGKWSWEERYVVLLWLSHLLLAPFDLSTISSVDLQDVTVPEIPGLVWPENLPAITDQPLQKTYFYLGVLSFLADIVHALLLGLSFEQRSMSGGSVGTNVRDAACFGIWALARRYTSSELLAIPTHSVFAAKAHPATSSILQVLATELVVTASLDPAGNIRRGASAALQELVGRHPDTVEQGIWVVQTVDYHAVARRSRAIEEVAVNATRLASQYGEAIIDTLLGWRGIGDLDAASRRVSGAAFGVLTYELSDTKSEDSLARFKTIIQLLTDRLKTLQPRQVEERHGALENLQSTAYRKPELLAEAASRLVVSALPILQVSVLGMDSQQALCPGQELLHPGNVSGYLGLVSALDSCDEDRSETVARLISALRAIIPTWLNRSEQETIEPTAAASLVLLILSKPIDREALLSEWAETVQRRPTSRTSVHGIGYFSALTVAQPLVSSSEDVACQAILERWTWDSEVETRVAILQSLAQSSVLHNKPLAFLQLIVEGLNDYTTNARGDVGSHVRVHALRAVKALWNKLDDTIAQGEWEEASVQALFFSVLRLAAEKLDRVRPEAQAAVALVLENSHAKHFRELTFSSRAYFESLLELQAGGRLRPLLGDMAKGDTEKWMTELMSGFVGSADTGNEDLVIASRAALCDFCEAKHKNLDLICHAMLQNLKSRQGQDRVIVPTLEIIAFLFQMQLFQKSSVNLRSLCLQTQKAGYKTGNVRKLEACTKVYCGIASMAGQEGAETGVQEARKRLGALLHHPWPKVRSMVVDGLWGVLEEEEEIAQKLKGVDWGQAGKLQIKTAVEELRLG